MGIDQKIVVLAGPTGSGKSEVAISLAKEFNGELICSDSMQVYRQMDVGTACLLYTSPSPRDRG